MKLEELKVREGEGFRAGGTGFRQGGQVSRVQGREGRGPGFRAGEDGGGMNGDPRGRGSILVPQLLRHLTT